MRDWLRPNISRVDYWKHVMASMCLFVTIIFFGFLPFFTNAPESLTLISFNVAVAIPLYNLFILIGRLRNLGRGFWSGLLWLIGLMTPLINFVVLVRLGLLKAEGESDFTSRQKFWVALAAAVYISFIILVAIARAAIDMARQSN